MSRATDAEQCGVWVVYFLVLVLFGEFRPWEGHVEAGPLGLDPVLPLDENDIVELRRMFVPLGLEHYD